MTWIEVDEYLKTNDIVIVPIGSTEQHGPALPLGLDTYTAITLAEDAARQTGVLVTPPIWFGDSPHHLAFAGTVSIRTEVVAEYVKDVIRSLAKHGFKKILILNGHKITNLDALHSATRNLKEYELPHIFMAVIDPIKIGSAIANKIKESKEHHSGELEASHMLHKFPNLVHLDKLPSISPDLQEKYSKFMKSDLFSGGDSIDIVWSSEEQKNFTENTGSFSDATKATVKKGVEYHEGIVNNIVDFINWLKNKKVNGL
ncbi:MAG: creatininase family protein [Candidatus Aenigmarchaeota archaeon]|nr:creatininase family protein [Candidatus Aenigmarchaeota archaeon]